MRIKLSVILVILSLSQLLLAFPKLQVNNVHTISNCSDNQTSIIYQHLRFCINNQNILNLNVMDDSVFMTLKNKKIDLFFGEDNISKQDPCVGIKAPIKDIESKVGVSSVRALFSKLFSENENSHYINKVRNAFNINKAKSLTQYNNHQYIAYWINTINNQRLYIIPENQSLSERLFFIQGNIDQELIKDFLSYLVIDFN